LTRDGQVVADASRDILKLVVLERHHATGNVGVGFVRGFKLRTGALGSRLRTTRIMSLWLVWKDRDILQAIEEMDEMQGGQVAVCRWGSYKRSWPCRLRWFGLGVGRLRKLLLESAQLNTLLRNS
jgi:adenine deaminase